MKKITFSVIEDLVNSKGFKLLNIIGEGCKSRIVVECLNGHSKSVTLESFKKRPKCYECIPHQNTMSVEEFNKNLSIKNKKSKLIGKYSKASDILEFVCLNCGKTFKMRGAHALRGHGCKDCSILEISRKLMKSHEVFVSEVYSKFGNEFEILSKYNGDSEKITIKHSKCGKISTKNAGNLLAYGGCKYCKESKGEKKISEFLEGNKVNFIREYKDNRCRFKYPLPFDFAIIKNDKPIILIEYDGELHYKTSRWSNALEALQKTILRDNIKSEFAKNNNIKLIRIPYWDFDNIEKILKHELRTLL